MGVQAAGPHIPPTQPWGTSHIPEKWNHLLGCKPAVLTTSFLVLFIRLEALGLPLLIFQGHDDTPPLWGPPVSHLLPVLSEPWVQLLWASLQLWCPLLAVCPFKATPSGFCSTFSGWGCSSLLGLGCSSRPCSIPASPSLREVPCPLTSCVESLAEGGGSVGTWNLGGSHS